MKCYNRFDLITIVFAFVILCSGCSDKDPQFSDNSESLIPAMQAAEWTTDTGDLDPDSTRRNLYFLKGGEKRIMKTE
jgi:hypothetical protein